MVIENRDKYYEQIAWKLFNILRGMNYDVHLVSVIGFFIALHKDNRLNPDDYNDLVTTRIVLDSDTIIRLSDVCDPLPMRESTISISHIIRNTNSRYCVQLFEAVIKMAMTNGGRSFGEFSQPYELTRLVNSLLNENHVSRVYNPFAGIGSYQLDNRAVSYYSQEINRNIWMVGKLRMYINDISCEFTNENSILDWVTGKLKFDAIVATPPFRSLVDIERNSIIRYRDVEIIHKTVESQYLSSAITSVEEKGVVIGVVPMRFLFDTSHVATNFRQCLLECNLIQEVIQLPLNIFNATAINTAIIVLSKRENTSIKFVDASECFTQSGKINILDTERVNDLRKNSNSVDMRNISVAEVIEQNYDLTPSRYLEEEEVVPDGFNLIQLKDVVTTIRGVRVESDIEGVCINIGDLSSDSLNCILDVNSFTRGKTKNNFRRITSPVLLLSKVRVLKPTYIEASEFMPIYISSNVIALEVDTTKISVLYLAYELSLKSDKLHRGVVIPNFRPNDILDLKIKIPALSSHKDILLQEKAMIESLILEAKKAKIKEFGLEEIIETERQTFAAEIKVRKHDMMPYIREMNSIAQLIRHYAKNINEDIVGNIIHLVSKQESAIQSLNSLIEALSIDETFGKAEVLDIHTYFHNLEIEHIDSLGYGVQLVVDSMSLMDGGLVQEPEISSIDPSNPLSSLKRAKGLLLNIAKSDMDNLVKNIIENAVHHGFVDKSRKDYAINIHISYNSKKEMFRIDFSNNGKPLPEGLTTERYAIRGEKAGATGKTGIGGYRVKSIVQHYGGEIELYNDPSNPYPVTISIYLPIFRDDE